MHIRSPQLLRVEHARAIMQRGSDVARPDSRRHALALALWPAVAIVLLVALLVPPVAQPESYHHFHDGRGAFGIPNALNVVSNLPFALFGLMGVVWLLSRRSHLEAPLRRCYAVMFAGVALTSIGSAYYHWSPDTATLVWDRLPMAVAFMGLFAGFLTERLRLEAVESGRLLAALPLYGLASVGWWAVFDDLRFYAIAQFYPIIAIPLILRLTPAPFTHGSGWLAAIGVYVAAKALEHADGVVFAAGHVVSGHTLKHLAAAFGAWVLYRMLTRRQALG